MITQKELHDLFTYNKKTGRVIRKFTIGGSKKGRVVGSEDGNKGYLRVVVKGKNYFIHRIIWLYVTGNWLKNQNKKDNRWSNLREANNSENKCNTRVRKDSKSKIKGVTFEKGMKRIKRWRAYITVAGKRHWLGFFATKREAYIARKEANIMHGQFRSM